MYLFMEEAEVDFMRAALDMCEQIIQKWKKNTV